MQARTGAPAVDHYQDEYWNDLPEVLAYLCRLATDDPTVWWIDYVKRKYAAQPRRRALLIGCGNGWVERDLCDRGVAERFDAFDASLEYLREAEAKRGGRPIRYFEADFATFVPEAKYDLVVNVAALHHARRLYRSIHVLAAALVPDGIFVNWEYIGPSRNQYTRQHLAVMEGVNASLPPRFRTRHPLLHPLSSFLKGDPTEAVHAAEIERAFAQLFDVVERRPLNGGIAYQLLWNNVSEFRKGDPEAARVLEWLLGLDESLTRAGAVPPLFAFFIGRPRRNRPLAALVDRAVREPLREAFASATGGRYLADWLSHGERHRIAAAMRALVRQH